MKEPFLNILRKHSKIALCYFLIIAFLGVLLRFFSIIDFPINYRFTVHGHSHVALLGWIYTALSTLVFTIYLKDSFVYNKYKRLFWATQITIIGMLVTFPFTGYALFSIIFSSLFIIASYFFSGLVFKYTPSFYKQTHSYKCIRIALWYMIISSIGAWGIGIVMKIAGSGSPLYKNAIYFYLHFQYNGWFVLALIGIFLYILEQYKIILSKKTFQSFFWLLNIGVILTFGISLLWMKPPIVVFIVSGIGAVFQLIAFFILFQELRLFKKQFSSIFPKFNFLLLLIIILLFFLKLLFQIVGSVPYFANVIAANIDFIIGYLHWTFLGLVSIALLLFLHHFYLIKLSKRDGLIYITGFLLTEFFIFYKGIVVWANFSLFNYYFESLVIVSCLLFVGILNIFMSQFKRK